MCRRPDVFRRAAKLLQMIFSSVVVVVVVYASFLPWMSTSEVIHEPLPLKQKIPLGATRRFSKTILWAEKPGKTSGAVLKPFLPFTKTTNFHYLNAQF